MASKINIFVLLATVLLQYHVIAASFDAETLNAAKYDIAKLIVDNKVPKKNDYPFIAGFVRLIFHDCAGTGRCDGSLDLDAPGNKGLRRYAEPLDELYKEHEAILGKADFYVLAAVTALEMATTVKPDASIKFDSSVLRLGRKTSQTPEGDVTYPKMTDTFKMQEDFFKHRMGLDVQEMVALIGAHTLGAVHKENSGVQKDTEWIPGNGCSSTLNNRFYKKLVGQVKSYGLRETEDKKPFWTNRKNNAIMLQSDVNLFWDMTFTEGKPDCRLSGRRSRRQDRCSAHESVEELVKDYARNNAKWGEDFTKAIFKMFDQKQGDELAPCPPLKRFGVKDFEEKKSQKGKRPKGKRPSEKRAMVEDLIQGVLDDIEKLEERISSN